MVLMRFINDLMLGKLARWLRLLGHDTAYGTLEDQEIIRRAKSESRTILSRDQRLIDTARREDIAAIYVSQANLEDQVVELYDTLGLAEVQLDPDSSRCPLCNGELAGKRPEEVRELVPPKVFEYHSQFWKCVRCDKVYWMGRHWDDIEKKINAANNELARDPD